MGEDRFYGEEHFTPSAENSAALAAENRQKSSHVKFTEAAPRSTPPAHGSPPVK